MSSMTPEEIQREVRNAINTAIGMYTTQKLDESSENPFAIGSCVIIGMVNALMDFVAMQERTAYLFQQCRPFSDFDQMPYPITRNMREHVLMECKKVIQLYQKD